MKAPVRRFDGEYGWVLLRTRAAADARGKRAEKKPLVVRRDLGRSGDQPRGGARSREAHWRDDRSHQEDPSTALSHPQEAARVIGSVARGSPVRSGQ